MDETLNECPECLSREQTERQDVQIMSHGVDIVYSCADCHIDYVVELRRPVKEVSHRYDYIPE